MRAAAPGPASRLAGRIPTKAASVRKFRNPEIATWLALAMMCVPDPGVTETAAMADKHDDDNRSNQLNPNNDAYWQSRGHDDRPDNWDEQED